MKTAKIEEIFDSIQGEGLYTGARQIFIRFFGCNIACCFCDTKQKDFVEYSADSLRAEVSKYSGFHSLSLTGGEPLLQADFLSEFLGILKLNDYKIYLETNGILPEELAKIIDRVDIISMDFKLPSSTKAGIFWKEHEDFLKLAVKKQVFVKMVVTVDTKEPDIIAARSIIKKIKADIPVILQPSNVLPEQGCLENMLNFKRDLTLYGIKDVRILPQMHKLAGIK
jgi:7-carboxy-7-deazaguanine synthase